MSYDQEIDIILEWFKSECVSAIAEPVDSRTITSDGDSGKFQATLEQYLIRKGFDGVGSKS